MVWRSVLIESPVELKLEAKQFTVIQDHEKSTIPIEDLALIVIDGHAKISCHLLAELAVNNVAVVFCDTKHVPCGILESYLQHCRFAAIFETQLKATLPLKKRLWQRVIQQKILNQGSLIQHYHGEDGTLISALANKVQSGDPQNIEGQAARLYWKNLFGKAFRRMRDDWTNSALNYGYTILRSVVIRGIVSRGLFPTLGIHHNNQLNQFALADDLIEPFRIAVDSVVCQLNETREAIESGLSRADKITLISAMHNQIKINGEQETILRGVEDVATSFVEALKNNDSKKLVLPEVCL